jgi:AraC-like DNA-binding protein
METQTTNPTESMKASINLNVEHMPTLINFMVSHQIPFMVDFRKKTPLEDNRPTPHEVLPDEVRPPANPMRAKKIEIEIVESICDKYLKNITDEIPLVSIIAEEYGISVIQLKNYFKAVKGKAFYQLYMEKKMAYAASLLAEGHTANTVSKLIGYSHPIKFNKMFQKYYGTTPFKYKKEHFE